jgi:anti-sigma factor RsiW
MTTCLDFESLIRDRLTGDLDEAGATRLDAHLAGCPACRAEANGLDEILSLAKLPPPSQKEMHTLEGVTEGVLRTFRFGERRRSVVRGMAVGVLVAAAVVVMALAPALMRGPPSAESNPWEVPDLDALWTVSSIVDPDSLADDVEDFDTDVLNAGYEDASL